MKAVRLRDATCVNPEFNRQLNKQRIQQGLEPLPQILQRKRGEIVEGDNLHLLCVGPNPALAPEDDECSKAVVKLLNRPSRKADLDRLRRMHQMKEDLSPEGRKYVEDLFSKYSAELNGETPAQVQLDQKAPDRQGKSDSTGQGLPAEQGHPEVSTPDESDLFESPEEDESGDVDDSAEDSPLTV